MTEEFWQLILSTNLIGPFRCAHAAAAALKATKGAIVNTASVAGLGRRGSSMAYGAVEGGRDQPDQGPRPGLRARRARQRGRARPRRDALDQPLARRAQAGDESSARSLPRRRSRSTSHRPCCSLPCTATSTARPSWSTGDSAEVSRCHSGAPRSGEPGTHKHGSADARERSSRRGRSWLWVPGSPSASPGMTRGEA